MMVGDRMRSLSVVADAWSVPREREREREGEGGGGEGVMLACQPHWFISSSCVRLSLY